MNRRILKLAIPNILSNLSVPLLGMVDTALMGHMSSPIYLGAVGIGGTIFNFLYWSLGFLRMGTTGLAAQAFGARDDKQLSRILIHALAVAFTAAGLFLILQVPIENLAMSFFPAQEKLLDMARLYFSVRIWAAPATIGLYALMGWFLGMQNARFPLIISVLSNAANIGLSVLFVRSWGWGIAGVAWATVLAQYIGFVTALALLIYKYGKSWKWPEKEYLLDLVSIRRFFGVNGDIFIRTLCLIFVFGFFTAQSTVLGAVILASNQVLRQFLDIMAYGVDGFAFATESLVGRYVGEKKAEELKKALRLLFIWGVGLGLTFSLIFWLLGPSLIDLFTDQEIVKQTCMKFLPWQYAMPLVASIAFMYDGAFLGATASRPMRNMMLLSTLLVFLPSWYLFKDLLGNHALWMAIFLFMLSRAISLAIVAPKHLKVSSD